MEPWLPVSPYLSCKQLCVRWLHELGQPQPTSSAAAAAEEAASNLQHTQAVYLSQV